MTRRVRISSSRSPYRRGGVDIGSGEHPTIRDIDELGPEAVHALAMDPNVELAVEVEGKWLRMKRAELDLAIEAATTLTGQRAINPSPSTVPGAAAVTPIAAVATRPAPTANNGEEIVSRTGEMLPAESLEGLFRTGGMIVDGAPGDGAPGDGATLTEAARIAERERLAEAERAADERLAEAQRQAEVERAERPAAERAKAADPPTRAAKPPRAAPRAKD